jgi:hypothetical protein
LGVPTVYCAPGDIRNCHTLEERVELQEYFDGIVAFAAFLARIGPVATLSAARSEKKRRALLTKKPPIRVRP